MTANPGISEEELNAIYSAMDIFGVQGSLPTAADALSAAKQVRRLLLLPSVAQPCPLPLQPSIYIF